MRPSGRRGDVTPFPALRETADQDWGSVVASCSKAGWPPPSWFLPVRAGGGFHGISTAAHSAEPKAALAG